MTFEKCYQCDKEIAVGETYTAIPGSGKLIHRGGCFYEFCDEMIQNALVHVSEDEAEK